MATKTTISWEEFLASGSEGQRWEWAVYPDRPLEYIQEGESLTIAGLPEFALDIRSLFTF